MASLISSTKVIKNFILGHLLILFITIHQVSCHHQHLKVGGEKGWIKPSANQSDAYNEWANRHRFYVGDILYFRYHHHNESVLQVSQGDYESCNTSNPIRMPKRQGGRPRGGAITTIKLDKDDCMYFISGIPSHCKAGERMSIFVFPHLQGSLPPPLFSNHNNIIHESCNFNHDNYDDYHFNFSGQWPPLQSSAKRVMVTAAYSTCFMAIFFIVTAFIY